MKFAIISDSHDNIPNIEKFLSWAEKNEIEMIIHCGDIAAPAMIKQLFGPKFIGPIHLVYGNVADRELLPQVCKQFKNIKLHGDSGEVFLAAEGGKKIKIAFCHLPTEARDLAETGRYQLVFYGHTHKPWMETLANGCQLINPGTLGGIFNKATFAVYNTATGELELKVLEKL